jgi:hypothetical protein
MYSNMSVEGLWKLPISRRERIIESLAAHSKGQERL